MNIYLLCIYAKFRKTLPAAVIENINCYLDSTAQYFIHDEIVLYTNCLLNFSPSLRLGYYNVQHVKKITYLPTVKSICRNYINTIFCCTNKRGIKVPRVLRIMIYDCIKQNLLNLLRKKNQDFGLLYVATLNNDTDIIDQVDIKADWVSSLGCSRGNEYIISKILNCGGIIPVGPINYAAQKNHTNILLMALDNCACDINNIFVWACFHGNMIIAKKIIFSVTTESLMAGLKRACLHKQIEIVELIKENFAVNLPYFEIWSSGSVELLTSVVKYGKIPGKDATQIVCANGHLNLVIYLINNRCFNFKHGFMIACGKNRLNIVEYLLINKYINYYPDIEFEHAYNCQKMQLVELLVFYISDKQIEDSFLMACSVGDLWLVKKITTYRGKNLTSLFNSGVNIACEKNHSSIIKYLAKFDEYLDWNKLLLMSCKTNNLAIAKFTISKGATQIEEAIKICFRSCNHDRFTKYLLGLINK